MAMTGGTAKLVRSQYANYGNASWKIDLYVYYTISQSIGTNESYIRCGMYVVVPAGVTIGPWYKSSNSYVGTTDNTFNGEVPNFTGTRWITEGTGAEIKAIKVTHDDKGEATATIHWKWGVNSPWGGFVNPSGSFTVQLPKIERLTTPVLSSSTIRMGEVLDITLPRKATTLFHDLKITLNGTTKTIAQNKGDSYSWQVPDLVSLMPNATSAVATLTCDTYYSAKLLGSKSVTLTINAFPATTPNTDTEPAVMCEELTISLERQSSVYTHNLTYSMGSQGGVIATGVGASYKWIVPEYLISELPNKISGELTITCVTKNGTAIVGTTTKVVQVKVPRASVPSVTPDGADMGTSLTVDFNRKSSQYKHTFSIILGDKAERFLGITDATHEFSVPLDFAAEIPYDTSGTIKLSCSTYNGSAFVGTEIISFTAKVPDNEETKPNFTMSFEAVNDSLSDTFNGLFIQSKSQVKVTFDASSDYADIASYAATIEGTAKTGTPLTSDTLTKSGELTVVGVVIDSRGYSRTVEQTIPVIPYFTPRLVPYNGNNSLVCTRSYKDGPAYQRGEYVLVQAVASFAKIMADDVQKNFCKISYRYRTTGSTTFSSWKDLDGTTIDRTLDEVFSIKTAYIVQLRIRDDIGEEKIVSFPIPDLSVPMHLGKGGKNLGLGQYCDYSEQERIDIGWKTYFNTGIGKKTMFVAKSGAWNNGESLLDVFPEADITDIDNYNLFIVIGYVGGNYYPILCVKNGNRICGSYKDYFVRLTGNSNALGITDITEGMSVTALYALL